MAEMRLGPFTLPGAMLSEVEPAGHRKPRFEAWTENGMTYVACNTPLRPTSSSILSSTRSSNKWGAASIGLGPGWIYLSPPSFQYLSSIEGRCSAGSKLTNSRIPINEVPLNHRIRCKLDPKLAQSWLRLEEALVKVANLLLPLTDFPRTSDCHQDRSAESLCFKRTPERNASSLSLIQGMRSFRGSHSFPFVSRRWTEWPIFI